MDFGERSFAERSLQSCFVVTVFRWLSLLFEKRRCQSLIGVGETQEEDKLKICERNAGHSALPCSFSSLLVWFPHVLSIRISCCLPSDFCYGHNAYSSKPSSAPVADLSDTLSPVFDAAASNSPLYRWGSYG
jgi:hypothetical protein